MLSAAGYVYFFQSEIMRICEGKIWKVTTVLLGKTAPKPKGLLWMQLFHLHTWQKKIQRH